MIHQDPYGDKKEEIIEINAEGKDLSPPGDFRSWESPQILPAFFIGLFEHVERFRNLKFAVKRITNI